MNKSIIHVVSILMIFISSCVYAEASDYQLFEELFTNWTNAFNQKNLEKSCDLFSKSIIADYQGAPKKNYQTICNGFEKIFKVKHIEYKYTFKLHHVYRSDNLAAVRITWYLRIYDKGALKSLTQDEGIDILKRNQLGEWRIVNYLAYPQASRER